MLLVAGGGLFARSLYNLQHLNRGFDSDHLVSFTVAPALSGYDQTRIRPFYDRLLADIRGLPGVTSASLSRDAVLTGDISQRTIEVLGYQTKPDEDMNPWVNEVAPDYFRTMRLPLVAGREFTERDVAGAPLVAIVNETFADYYFGTENPIGRRVGWRTLENPGAIEIVGVVKDAIYADMRQGADGKNETPRFIYTPFQQGEQLNEMTMYARAVPTAAAAMPDGLRRVVRRVDPSMPIFGLRTVDSTVDRALFAERMLALLSAAFGLVATVLAAIGLYGVMSFTVARRTREIGIRVALGADQSAVLWLVLGEVAILTVVGILLGIPVALGLSRLVSAQLFGISPSDPSTLAGAALLLTVVGLTAGWLPARRAAGIEPILALRHE